MAIVSLNTIKSWFKTGLKPTQSQFWDAWDSFRHKSDKVPYAEVEGLDAVLLEQNNRIAAIALPDGVTKHGSIIVNSGSAFIPAADFVWREDQVEYTNTIDFSAPVPAAVDGYMRTDIFVGTKLNTIVRVAGPEAIGVAVRPDVLVDTIELGSVDVEGATVSVPVIVRPKAPVSSVNGMIGDVVIPQYFKGIHLTEAALSAAHPTSIAGAYAQVNVVGSTDVVNYSWDAEENIWVNNGTGGSGAVNTDALPEGSVNLYFTVARFLANLTAANIKAALGISILSGSNTGDQDLSGKQDSLISGTNIKTVNGTSLLGSGDITVSAGGGGDMVLASTQIVSGLKTFLSGMFGLRNAANTFTSFISNAATASRTWTFQDKSYTVADNADLAGKMANPTGGIASYLPKFLTANTMGLSRLLDTGTFFGIGVTNTPLKSITLSYDSNKDIGIEDSDNTTKGRDLRVSAGRAINFVPSSGFAFINNGVNYKGGTSASNGDLYFTGNNKIYKQIGGAGDIADLGQTYRNWQDMTTLGSDIYAVCGTGDIYKQTGGTGDFIGIGEVSRNYIKITSSPSGNLYVLVSNGDVYKKTGAGAFTAMGITSPQVIDIAVSFDNNVYTINGSSQCVYKQTNETGSFVPYLLTAYPYPTGIAVSQVSNSIYLSTYGFGVIKQTNSTGSFLEVSPNIDRSADLYVFVAANGNVYLSKATTGLMKETNYAVGAENLDGGVKSEVAGTGKGTGKSRWNVYTGQKTTSGTNMQIETKRVEVDENGYFQLLTMPTYADNTAALAGGLVSGQFYRTSTGILMITY